MKSSVTKCWLETLSAGEQQLLSFARALMHIEHGQVSLVIMDEPTANIDMAMDYKGRQV